MGAGQYAESQAAAKSARKWVIWSAVIWLVGVIMYLIVMVWAVSTGDNTMLVGDVLRTFMF